jgi:hypothetical protein
MISGCVCFLLLFMWGVRASLCASRLILTYSEINDQESLQWPLILTTTGLESETTRGAYPLVPGSYH